MGDYRGIGDAIAALYIFAVASTIVAWPLAIWKLYDIIVWLFKHIHWS